jgi:hypothetical protein
MSEITPDPVFDKLTRFTPSASSLDPAEVLFRAGRASAGTTWAWKLAVSGLAIAISALIAERLLNNTDSHAGSQEAIPVVVVIPVPIPLSESNPLPSPAEPESPWRFGALLHATDPNDLPKSPAPTGLAAADPPLMARTRELD